MASKKTKKIISTVIIAVVLVAIVISAVAIYKILTNSTEGKYYYQQDSGKYLEINKDNTFSYVQVIDDTTEEISKGTWSSNGNELNLTFSDSGSSYTFIRTDDGYIYRNDKIYRGKTSSEKLLNNRFVLEKDGEVIEEIWFLDDGTVDYEIKGDGTITHGTYTRVDDILIARYQTKPDSFGNVKDVVHRYLVLENGITREIYSKNPPENVAK